MGYDKLEPFDNLKLKDEVNVPVICQEIDEVSWNLCKLLHSIIVNSIINYII